MAEQSDATKGVRELFAGTTPERLADVAELIESTQYELAHERPARHLEATGFFGKGLVVLTNRTLQQTWLIAYLTWQTVAEQSGSSSYRSRKSSRTTRTLLHKHDKHLAFVDRLGQALADLRNAGTGDNPWPSDVPQLDLALSQLRNQQDRAAYDFSCFAAAFVLLHETYHAQKRGRGEPYEGIREELACDAFAIEFLLSQSDTYATQRHYDADAVYRKRAMGILVGLAVAFESTEVGRMAAFREPPIRVRPNPAARRRRRGADCGSER